MQYGDWKWLKNILDTACYVIHLNFSADDLIIYISLNLWMCIYTEKQVFCAVKLRASCTSASMILMLVNSAEALYHRKMSSAI